MHIVVDDNADLEKVERAYFRKLLEADVTTLAGLARSAGLSVSTIQSRFEHWGWNWRLDTPEPAEPTTTTTAAPPQTAPPARDFLEPETRARLKALKARRRPTRVAG